MCVLKLLTPNSLPDPCAAVKEEFKFIDLKAVSEGHSLRLLRYHKAGRFLFVPIPFNVHPGGGVREEAVKGRHNNGVLMFAIMAEISRHSLSGTL